MPIIKSDIRLINGDVSTVAGVVKEYLSSVNFNIDQEKLTKSNANIKASNLQRSVIKLYLSNSPQIIHWHVKKRSDTQVQIEIKCDLFRKFRVFYHVSLGILLIGFNFFLALSLIDKLKSTGQLDQLDILSSAYYNHFLVAASFLLLAFIFYLKSINSASYEQLLNRFYGNLIRKSFTNEIVLQSALGFPDLLKGFLLFIVFLLIPFIFLETNLFYINKYQSLYFFGVGTIIIIGTFVILLLMMIARPAIAKTTIFTLLSFGLCVPIIMYSNAPLELSFFGDIEQKFENSFGVKEILNSNIEILQNTQKNNHSDSRKFIHTASVFYISAGVLIFLLSIVLFVNIIQLPIRILRDLKKFLSRHTDSAYHQALQLSNTSYIFNLVILLLWITISIANILGLYFAFSIFERTIFGLNFLFNSEMARLFFENTKISLVVLLLSAAGGNVTILFHKIFMMIYSIPLIMIFILVIKKNLKSLIEGYSLLKSQSDKYEKIEKQLAEKIKEICKSANVEMPIIRMIDPPNINGETKYIGFPIFKNILMITEGAWNELNDKEEELNILLAHEVWHIKKHTLTRKFLCFLSDYSLFGNGFLALLQNSFKIEKDADDFAVKWLITKYQDRDKAISSLQSLLERIEEINWRNTLFQSGNFLNFAMFKEDSYRNELLKMYDNSSIIEKIKINLKLLYQMYFGREILSYFHPSISQRIAWIEENYNTNEAI